MAPFSVHACAMPEGNKDQINPSLEAAVDRLLQIIVMGRQKRAEVKIKVKTPLSCLTVIHRDKDLLASIQGLESYILRELNVKTVRYESDEGSFIRLYAKANLPVLGKRLGKRMGHFRSMIENLDTDQLVAYEQNPTLSLEGEVFEGDEVLVYREPLNAEQVASNAAISIALDTTLNEDLIQEGIAREVINRVQKTRKELGFCVSDRIHLYYRADAAIAKVIERHAKLIGQETLAVVCVAKEGVDQHGFEIEDKGYLYLELVPVT